MSPLNLSEIDVLIDVMEFNTFMHSHCIEMRNNKDLSEIDVSIDVMKELNTFMHSHCIEMSETLRSTFPI